MRNKATLKEFRFFRASLGFLKRSFPQLACLPEMVKVRFHKPKVPQIKPILSTYIHPLFTMFERHG